MHKKLFLFVIIALLLSSCLRNEPMVPKRVLLHDNWTVHRSGSDTLYKARVPGCVHLDLMNNNVIPDPYFGEYEKEVQWIENEDWVYQTRFRATALLLDYGHIDLVFGGLDTWADVYLNDSLVLRADNMFREWRVDVKPLLVKGHNDLTIVFHSPVKKNRELAGRLSYPLPDDRAFSRKAPYMFGWDWGPRLVTSGIWKPVYFEAWEKLKIREWKVVTDYLGRDSANVRLIVEVMADDTMTIDCRYRVSVKDRVTMPVSLKKGSNSIEIPFTLEEPKLWWTHNLGEPFLYDFTVAFGKEHQPIEQIRDKFGLRTVELVHETDEYGKSFYFKLNGVPVFMKGANYIPLDNFPSRVGKDRLYQVVQNAKLANMNMLRVWGGGIYEDDLFYAYCDREGILVWQDFMFACAMYPGDSSFLANVEEEAAQQVKRLRNHPSLALWCGNNEVDEAWHNWGWQKQFGYSAEDSARIWEDYLELFHDILPRVVSENDAMTDYWPSSPKHGWGRKESLTDGDMHYWGVWWGREPFSRYNEKVGRFMSEYGFQGYPPYATLEKYIPEDELYVGSPSLLNHQKHPFGEEVIREFMEKAYTLPPAQQMEDYAYLSQLTQAYGIRTAIEAHRRNMPRCMGTLYWQLNDCWPAISWSSLDYHNRWKALHFFAKRAYKNVALSAVVENGMLHAYAMSDLLRDTTGTLSITSMDLSGKILHQDSLSITLPAHSSRLCYSIDLPAWMKNERPENMLVQLSFQHGNTTLAERIVYFAAPGELKLADPDISIEFVKEKKQVELICRSDVVARDIFLSFGDIPGRFSDNFFDLLPGVEKRVVFYPLDEDELPLKEDLSIKHLRQVILPL